jgi:hypothetical protein
MELLLTDRVWTCVRRSVSLFADEKLSGRLAKMGPGTSPGERHQTVDCARSPVPQAAGNGGYLRSPDGWSRR